MSYPAAPSRPQLPPRPVAPVPQRAAEQRGLIGLVLAGVQVLVSLLFALIRGGMLASAFIDSDTMSLVNLLTTVSVVLALLLGGGAAGLGLSALIGPDRSVRARVLGALAAGAGGQAVLAVLIGLAQTGVMHLFA